MNKNETSQTFDEFSSSIDRLHKLNGLPFLISYIDPRDNDLLPINNDDNFHRALTTARPLLRIIISKKGDSFDEVGYGTMRPKNNLISSLLGQTPVKAKMLAISNPHDFRQVSSSKCWIYQFRRVQASNAFRAVYDEYMRDIRLYWDDKFHSKHDESSSCRCERNNILSRKHNNNEIPYILFHNMQQVSQIIDVDIVPETCRRVRLLKHGSDKPLGFYIRDGTSVKVTPNGIEKQPGIFISRLVPGGLAESTGLLAVNDEVLEVNGIEVHGKTLDQVTYNFFFRSVRVEQSQS